MTSPRQPDGPDPGRIIVHPVVMPDPEHQLRKISSKGTSIERLSPPSREEGAV